MLNTKNILNISLGLTILIASTTISSTAAVRKPKMVKNGMVSSDHYLASQAGAEVLKKGGNAIDAAIATSMVLSVVRNQSTGIGGGGFMVLHTADGENTVIDYREIAPKKAHRDMYLDKNKKPIPRQSTFGFKAAAVPGMLSGLDYALKKYGTMELSELMQPAIKYAEEGWQADEHFVEASNKVNNRGTTNELKEIFFIDGKPAKLGEWVDNDDLAETLKKIAKNGVKEFYEGETAKKIAAEVQKNGGLITLEDLKNYKPKIRKALEGSYKGYKIIAMPPPSSGGTALIEILNILEPFNLGWNSTGYGSSKHIHLVAEAMKHAFADRAELLGDPDFVDVPVDRLISKRYANKLRGSIDLDHVNSKFSYGTHYLNDDHGTTHFSVADKYGNLVSATETVNTYFGSNAIVKGTGILLNNEMDDFSKQPGVPNAFGLIGNEANAIQAGKKPLSSMSPTIVLKGDKPFMIVGASGGPRIITGTLQAIINAVDFGMNVEEAVSAPRIHHQWVPDKLFIEKEMPQDVRDNLQKKGHILSTGKAENAVQAILIKNGMITGASDPRKGGFPEGY